MIGFNGLQALPDTNRATAPLLQDVNKGWLQQLREQAAGRVLAGGKTAGKVVVGGGSGDYKSLDASCSMPTSRCWTPGILVPATSWPSSVAG